MNISISNNLGDHIGISYNDYFNAMDIINNYNNGIIIIIFTIKIFLIMKG